MKVLLIEDEKRMVEALSEIFRLEKYEVEVCMDGLSGLNSICSKDYDLVVLDVMLPEISGFEIVKYTRKIEKQTPILLLTAKSNLDDKVIGLDSGADDYMTKPFETRELLARMRALGRRKTDNNFFMNKLSFGDIFLESETFNLCCSVNENYVRLSKKEYQIIEYFLSNQKRVITREQLVLKIWGYDSEAEYNNVEVYISFLRKKLLFINSSTIIKSIRGIGYELRHNNV